LSFSHADGSLLPRQIASREFHSLIKLAALVGSPLGCIEVFDDAYDGELEKKK
jgi:hypothetical protein